MTATAKPKPYRGLRPKAGQTRDRRRLLFADALEANSGNLPKTAKTLGVHYRTAYRWWKELEAGTLLDHMDGGR